MKERIFEGTWEEVARWADKFTGHRVRVTILDEFEVPVDDGGSHAETAGSTAFDLLARAGLIGRLKAEPGDPTDLATNPSHMEGFGGE